MDKLTADRNEGEGADNNKQLFWLEWCFPKTSLPDIAYNEKKADKTQKHFYYFYNIISNSPAVDSGTIKRPV